jgi:hypothetical protein
MEKKMRKKAGIILFIIIISLKLFSQEYFNFPYEGGGLLVSPHEVIIYRDDEQTYENMPEGSFYVDGDGYYNFKNNDPITGGSFILFDFYGYTEFYKSTLGKNRSHGNEYYSEYPVQTITSSSYLIEDIKNKKIQYTPDNLYKFAYAPNDKSEQYDWNYDAVPWVEGVKGYGIGESITISYKEQISAIAVLNGYVDFQKTYLYKQNSRVKKFKVYDLDNTQEYVFELEDKVCFQNMSFNEKTRNIKLVIEEVYPGTKYDDTCVMGILSDYMGIVKNDYNETRKNDVTERIRKIKKEYACGFKPSEK